MAYDPRLSGTSGGCRLRPLSSRRMSGVDRVRERRRAAALARHYRDLEDLSIKEIASRLGRAEATVKAYLYDPTGEKARAVKARYVGVCRGCGAYTQPRNGKGDERGALAELERVDARDAWGPANPRAVPQAVERDEPTPLQRALHRRDGRVWRALPDRGRRPRPARRPRVPARPTAGRPDAAVRLLAPEGRGGGRAVAAGRGAAGHAPRGVNKPEPDTPNVKENQIMRDIATATLTGNLTREVELRPLPSGTEVARLRVASGARRRSGEEWVERTNYFTVEVYGPQASLCAERLGKGSRVVVDGQLDWREWTDQEQNRREAVVLRARQILFERMGPTLLADTDPAERDGSPDDEFGTAAVETSPAGADDVPF